MFNPCNLWSLDIVFHEHAELLVVAHQGAADAATVGDSRPACQALGVAYVEDTLRVALDVALFGGLTDAEHGLPPLEAIWRNGRFCSLIFYQYLRAVAVACGVGEGDATCIDDDAVLTAVDSSFIDNTL